MVAINKATSEWKRGNIHVLILLIMVGKRGCENKQCVFRIITGCGAS